MNVDLFHGILRGFGFRIFRVYGVACFGVYPKP